MDVGCPKCQTEYELDDARVTEDGVTVKCTSCGHVFRVKKKQLVVTLPVKDQTGSVPELPPAPPSREWKLRQSNGNIVPCRDLTMLQKWIIEGKVQRSDEISLTGETWKRLGDIPELASFFQIFDDAAKARALEAQQKVGPTGGKITETWRGGQFTAPAPEPLVPREQLEPETLPPEPPPRKRDTGKLPDFSTPPPVNQTIQGGRFSAAAPPVTETLQGGRFSAPPAPPVVQPPPQRAPTPPRSEPSDEDLRRAVKGGGSGKWILLVIAGLALGGGVGWYFGVYEPQQKRLAEEQAAALREKARLEEEARVKALEAAKAAEAVAVLDASVEVEADAGPDDAGVDAALEDAGTDAGVDAGVDAGAPVEPKAAPAAEPKRNFDWYLTRAEQLREREQTAAALDMYGKAGDLKPDRVEPIAGKGLCLLDMANLAAAEASFLQALSIAPRYGPAIMGLAEAYRMQGKNEKAIEYYQRYLDVLPNGTEAAVARNSIERLKKK